MPTPIRTALAATTVFFVLVPPVAAASTRQADRALERALDRVVGVPGGPPGVISIVHRDGRSVTHRAGVADRRTRRPWSPSLYMRLASTSKAFSGAVALSLVRRGRLELDDTIGERLPGTLPPAWSAVTLRQALHHTSGLPDYTQSPEFQAALGADLLRSFTRPQLIAFVADDPLVFAPDSDYAYSNTDNVVVALMAEAATGRSYERLLGTQVYSPLGLTRTGLPGDAVLPRPFAHGYVLDPPQPPEDVSEAISMSGFWASGGMRSTAADLSRFVRGYVPGRLFGRSLRADQRDWVRGGSEPTGPGTNSAGLALFRYRLGCGTVYGHTGNLPGYTQFAAASSDGRRSATVSINTQLTQETRPRAAFRALRRAYERASCAALASSRAG